MSQTSQAAVGLFGFFAQATTGGQVFAIAALVLTVFLMLLRWGLDAAMWSDERARTKIKR